jgi:hypothetical protein
MPDQDIRVALGGAIGKEEKAKGDPSKQFFIRWITRDISLIDCILDLIDNSIDSACAVATENSSDRLKGFSIHVIITPESFEIDDNCGGISLETAKNYAFTFGRMEGQPEEDRDSIGIYGIGMKRAVFKLGRQVTILSSTKDEGFIVDIDVADWAAKKDWDFPLQQHEHAKTTGTTIEVKNLLKDVQAVFAEDESVFVAMLQNILSRDYRFFIRQGLSIKVNGLVVVAHEIQFLWSDVLKPFNAVITEGEIECQIIAGIIEEPPLDTSPEEGLRPVYDFGWWVVCNDRVVLAADKTAKTVWGDEGFAVWHPQYNGFLGIVSFHSHKPETLPWTTTKRDIDTTNIAYRKAIKEMKRLTKKFLSYTGQRKANIDEAVTFERAAIRVSDSHLEPSEELILPTFPRSKGEYGTISYQRLKSDIERMKEAIGEQSLTNRAVGEFTFEYFWKREVGN